ncbi:proton-coupled zinc antiporter SLC30A2-like [Polymixia lowei]
MPVFSFRTSRTVVQGRYSSCSEDASSVDDDGPRRLDGHCHENSTTSRTETEKKRLARRKLLIACAVCLVFMTGEVIGGYFAHSLAIMTDAAHLLTDFGSIMISVFSLWISSRPRTKTMTFGWHRAEILGALLSVLSIWVVTGVLVFIAIQRIINDDYEVHGQVMLITAACAVGVNILMATILHQPSASHGHSHGFSYSRLHRDGKDKDCSHTHNHSNTSVRAAFIHVIGDLLQSIGVLLAATIIYFRPELKIADPICTFLFSVFVLGTTLTILKDILQILMEGTPDGIQFNTVKEMLLSTRGVKAAHNLRMWGLSTSHSLISVHVVIEENSNTEMFLREATKLLRSEFGFSSITVQVEQYSEDMLHCTECQDLNC